MFQGLEQQQSAGVGTTDVPEPVAPHRVGLDKQPSQCSQQRLLPWPIQPDCFVSQLLP